jgi:hypothetical protein
VVWIVRSWRRPWLFCEERTLALSLSFTVRDALYFGWMEFVCVVKVLLVDFG